MHNNKPDETLISLILPGSPVYKCPFFRISWEDPDLQKAVYPFIKFTWSKWLRKPLSGCKI